ncbi:MAG: transposase [Flavisolibacter sp.]|nr:transposase [Flavisolibacter sp.]MBD0331827.1 transposase [Chitinophagaceae bacterium]
MSKTSRRKFSAAFKSKVCIEAIKEQQTIEALAKKYELHPTQINTWKKEFLQQAAVVFEKEGQGSGNEKDQLIQALYAQIGEQKVAIDFLKKSYCKVHRGTSYAGRKRAFPIEHCKTM